jgi:H+-transporting ATPase
MTLFNFYPITTIMIILLALLNDLPIMTIAYDNTWLDPKPVRWDMRRILTVATSLGLIGVVETFGMLVLALKVFNFDIAQTQSLMYLKLAVAGHLTLFVARTKRPFLTKPYPAPVLLVAILLTQALAAAIVGFGLLVTPIPWKYVGIVWGYCAVWVFIEDWAKLQVYKHLNTSGGHHVKFLNRIKEPLNIQ